MKVGSFCSGIEGIGLGLERAGMEVVYHVEPDPTCQAVLRKHWPNNRIYNDVRLYSRRAIEAQDFPPVGLITAGYPCQPFSLAGRRRGAQDDRHLWPAIRRVIGVERPRWVLLENVPGHVGMGLERVLGDLAELGYDAEWDVLSAAQFGAPHLRKRLFIVARTAYPRGYGREGGEERDVGKKEQKPAQRRVDAGGRGVGAPHTTSPSVHLRAEQGPGREREGTPEPGHDREAPPHPYGPGPQEREGQRGHAQQECATAERGGHGLVAADDGWRWRGEGGFWAEAESPILAVDDGVPLDMVGSRVNCLRAIGNAVLPQIAEWIGRRIMEVEHG